MQTIPAKIATFIDPTVAATQYRYYQVNAYDSETDTVNPVINRVCTEYKNDPTYGFTLYPESLECIVDPRGFSYNIGIDNVKRLIKTTVVTRGVIQSKCVWTKTTPKAPLQLVSIDDPLFERLKVVKLLVGQGLDLGDVGYGDNMTIIRNTSGEVIEGEYLGKWHFHMKPRARSYSSKAYTNDPYYSHHAMMLKSGDVLIFDSQSVKLLRFSEDSTPLTTAEVIDKFRIVHNSTQRKFFEMKTRYKLRLDGVSPRSRKVHLTYEECNLSDALNIVSDGTYDTSDAEYIFLDKEGNYRVAYNGFTRTSTEFRTAVVKPNITGTDESLIIDYVQPYRSVYIPVDAYVKAYKIVSNFNGTKF